MYCLSSMEYLPILYFRLLILLIFVCFLVHALNWQSVSTLNTVIIRLTYLA